ncbi:glycosyltransferase [Nitrospirillum sp. BR 11752]|uniref:glycosyltransferase n=1 Tax=Nitrospirillum sp. BR 11752 TaxID=3104293 RepID=UPI002EB0313D|nr:glycosyltransferase [Nitrospirillum sp. BR 11752]
MRIAIVIPGTQGDVRPLVALGLGLARRGHRARIVTVDEFKPLVQGAGLEFGRLSGDLKATAAQHQAAFERGQGIATMLRTAQQVMRAMVAPWVAEGLAACQDTDLVLAGGGAVPLGASLAEALGRPFVQAYLQPNVLFGHLPSLRLPVPARALPSPVNRSLNRVLDLLAWQAQRPAVNDVVRKGLGLKPYPWMGPRTQMRTGWPILFGFSPTIVPPSPHWRARARVTGYWSLTTDAAWTPPARLVDFLAAGPAPLYIGFGSMTDQQAPARAELVVRALALTGQRAVLATGWGGLPPGIDAPEDQLMVIDGAPHDWLFPRVRAAVHHGGAGTIAAAVTAGIPSIIVPFLGDQFFWGWRARQLGVAPAPLSRKTMTAEDLAAAIRCTEESGMRARARALGDRIAAERGVDAAVTALGDWGLLADAALPALDVA